MWHHIIIKYIVVVSVSFVQNFAVLTSIKSIYYLKKSDTSYFFFWEHLLVCVAMKQALRSIFKSFYILFANIYSVRKRYVIIWSTWHSTVYLPGNKVKIMDVFKTNLLGFTSWWNMPSAFLQLCLESIILLSIQMLKFWSVASSVRQKELPHMFYISYF